MSINVYGHISRKCMDKDFLEKSMRDFFKIHQAIEKHKNANNIVYEGIREHDAMVLYFVSDTKPPYNIYESDIINDEFEYKQLIIFDMDKEQCSVDRYIEIINFCIYLGRRVRSDILVTSDAHNEMCLIKEQEIIWSQDLSFDYQAFCIS